MAPVDLSRARSSLRLGHGVAAIDYVHARARFESMLTPFKGGKAVFVNRVVPHTDAAFVGTSIDDH